MVLGHFPHKNFFSIFCLGPPCGSGQKLEKKCYEENDPKPSPKGIFHLKITSLQEIAPVFHLEVEKIEFLGIFSLRNRRWP